jgi:4-amino-4-deoxy-L-arabinose transferase-like glycosyltransferase
VRTAERGVLVGVVVVVAALLRIGFVATAKVQSPLRADAGQYAQYARNLCEHGTFSLSTAVPPVPDSFRSPGYPLLLAACRWLGVGGWQLLAIGLQVALGTLTVLLTYRLARQVLGFRPALLASALCALSPHLVVSAAYVLTECATTFFVMAAFWLAAGARSRSRLVAAALCCGFAVLCNETLVFLPLAIAWPLARAHRRWAVSFGLVALLPFACWIVRNRLEPLGLTGSERATASISHGSYPGMVFGDAHSFGYPYREDPEQPAFGSSWSALAEVLGRRVAADPWRYLSWYACEKPVWLWGWRLVQGKDVLVYEVVDSPYETQLMMQGTHVLMHVLHAPVMLLAVFGALCAAWWQRRTAAWPLRALGLTAIAATLAYLPVIPDPRYLQPFRPLLFVLAAAGATLVVTWWRRPARQATDPVESLPGMAEPPMPEAPVPDPGRSGRCPQPIGR